MKRDRKNIKFLFHLPASRHAGDPSRAGPPRPGYGEAIRRGGGQEVRLRGGLLQGHRVLVAEHEAADVEPV